MSIIVPITRRDFVQRPSVVLVPLPRHAAADPQVVQAVKALGVDAGAVSWGGGITLVAPLSAEDGRMVSVHAYADAVRPSGARELFLLAPGGVVAPVSARFLAGEGMAPVSLRLRLLRSQVVAAVVRHGDGTLNGVIADLRLLA